MKFFIKDFFAKCDQISRKLWIWSYKKLHFLWIVWLGMNLYGIKNFSTKPSHFLGSIFLSSTSLSQWETAISRTILYNPKFYHFEKRYHWIYFANKCIVWKLLKSLMCGVQKICHAWLTKPTAGSCRFV